MGRLNQIAEQHPSVAWVCSLISIASGWAAWLMKHADEFSKLVGLVGTLFGVVAGYYAMRITRRNWRRAREEDARAAQTRSHWNHLPLKSKVEQVKSRRP